MLCRREEEAAKGQILRLDFIYLIRLRDKTIINDKTVLPKKKLSYNSISVSEQINSSFAK